MLDQPQPELPEVLEERGNNYGDYSDMAATAQVLKTILSEAIVRRRTSGQIEMPPATHVESLDMICTKLARIVEGDPNNRDSWLDIAGYATLVADRLRP